MLFTNLYTIFAAQYFINLNKFIMATKKIALKNGRNTTKKELFTLAGKSIGGTVNKATLIINNKHQKLYRGVASGRNAKYFIEFGINLKGTVYGYVNAEKTNYYMWRNAIKGSFKKK